MELMLIPNISKEVYHAIARSIAVDFGFIFLSFYNPINMYSVQANIRISTKIIKVLKDIYGMKKTKEKLKINVQPV